jgi:two-component system, cell cycle response regulator
MDASILLTGDCNFLTHHLRLIRNLLSCTLETSSIADALSLIQAQQPDILLIQTGQEGSLELCRQIRAQSRLVWIYCILVEENGVERDESSAKTADPAIADPMSSTSSVLDIEIRGLNAGADAVIWRSPALEMLSGDAEEDMPSSATYGARLHAQIQAGLRRVQNHRDLMRTNDLLSTIALSDPLTELNNRRAFEWELPRQIKNARVKHSPISLLVLDVDFFKLINDNYGHLVGDRALHLIAARLRHNLRFCDIPFRYGGEEFVIILSDTDANEAFVVAQRLCSLIASQPFAIDEMLDLTITISAGTATLNSKDDERGISLLNRADQNLLKAKSQGRNRVVGYSDSFESSSSSDLFPKRDSSTLANCDCCDSTESRP